MLGSDMQYVLPHRFEHGCMCTCKSEIRFLRSFSSFLVAMRWFRFGAVLLGVTGLGFFVGVLCFA